MNNIPKSMNQKAPDSQSQCLTEMEDKLLENQYIKEKLEQLRRDHNELIIENSFMKKENEKCKRKLKEERKYKERYAFNKKVLLGLLDSCNFFRLQ